jgi:hypothetical protein
VKRALLYLAVFVTGFTIFVVAFLPASSAWLLVKDDVARVLPKLEVQAVTGTVWQGQAGIRYREFPPTDLDWSLSPLELLKGRALVDTVAAGAGHQLDGTTTITPDAADFSFKGHVDSDYINTVSRQYGLTFSGRLEIQRLHLAADPRWFTSADGAFSWPGGPIVYNTIQGPQTLTLPGLDGRLYLDGENLRLDVVRGDASLMSITLRPTGWVLVDLKARLFDLAALPWPAGAAPDDSALMLEEKLF